MTMPLADSGEPELPQAASPPPTPTSQVEDWTPSPAPIEHASPPSVGPDLDDDHDDAPLRFRRIDTILGDTGIPGMAECELGDELHAVSTEEPATLVEAKREPC
ncbi:hypothetical protein E2562_000285 [Oryza meyeriana var. granulata]|uniref:Uncharacterized protein n=1 Tax=Oryza meyeriana var. granulata TaxID=110450 RepID=A0A6G1CNM3_9ORYZ|nr:hypothetical protein E2562_000285 [Oryza meyeriana var. granulata]